MTDNPTPFAFRDRTLVLSLFDYVAEVEEAGPIPWLELLDTFTGTGRNPKTVENALYELASFGALHRIGRPPAKRGARDQRAVKTTPLGRAWRAGHVPGLPGEPDDPIDAAYQLAHDHDHEADLLADDVTATIGDPEE